MRTFLKTTMFAIVGTILASTSASYGESFIFPNQRQTQEQQSQDLHECNAQAKQETDFDPTQPIPNEEGQASQEVQNQRQVRIQAYNQVLDACLEKRGYIIQ
ncbi:MAG: hypothetical protein ACRDEA_01825 [Microcystaceae cyanobacterium]